jgi:hypothetical protein
VAGRSEEPRTGASSGIRAAAAGPQSGSGGRSAAYAGRDNSRRGRIARGELYLVRNGISINLVITQILNIPNKWSEGQLRFLCPACGEFNTATNPRTNLGRCFRCQRNYNPIDLVMATLGVGFVVAVEQLRPHVLAVRGQ